MLLYFMMSILIMELGSILRDEGKVSGNSLLFELIDIIEALKFMHFSQ